MWYYVTMAALRMLVQQPGDAILEAIVSSARLRDRWQLVAFSDHLLRLGRLPLDGAAGIIANTKDAQAAGRFDATGLPWINLQTDLGRGAHVACDRRAIGRLAAEHLAGLGCPHLAYLGSADEVHAAFRDACHPALVLRVDGPVTAALRRLPSGCAVLCQNDGRAVELIHAALAAGRGVPDDLAICGINNNRSQALCSPVPLTSIDRNLPAMAVTAAQALHRHLTTGTTLARKTLVRPLACVARRSTDVRHNLVPGLGPALRLLDQGLAVAATLPSCGLSRSTLERRFRDRLGTTPGAWRSERRLQRAAQLLLATELDCTAIAITCGLSSASYLCRAFQRRFGLTPSRYRAGQGSLSKG